MHTVNIHQVVFVSPFEHHANLLPWRESGAEVVWMAEDSTGKTDISDLERKLQVHYITYLDFIDCSLSTVLQQEW